METSIHFPAANEPDGKRKVHRLRLGDASVPVKKELSTLSSCEIRELVAVKSYDQLRTQAKKYRRSINAHLIHILSKKINIKQTSGEAFSSGRLGTYSGGRGDFFHDLFPYLEAFSPQFVTDLTEKYSPKAEVILDPFGGCGTTPFTFTSKGSAVNAYYCEINPVMQRVITLKEFIRGLSQKKRDKLKIEILRLANSIRAELDDCQKNDLLADSYQKVFGASEIFSSSTLTDTLRLKTLIEKLSCVDEPLSKVLEIAALSSLVPASNMQRAGDLRRKRPQERERVTDDITQHLETTLSKIADGINSFPAESKKAILLASDARGLKNIPSISADLIITSPPYLNGTNYLRNTKIELWFLGALKEKNDLGLLRDKVVTAGINDVRGMRTKKLPETEPFECLVQCLKELDVKAYDNRIPKMIRWYAHDLNESLSGALKHLKPKGTIAVDIGDSVYSDVKVPTDLLVIEILKRNGCQVLDQLTVRERMSRGGHRVKQVCIIARKKTQAPEQRNQSRAPASWRSFLDSLAKLNGDHGKRNWGHPNHSLCSYQGKLKPAIANFLVRDFVPENGTLLDPFSGVGTIPFEGALSGRKSYAFDISPAGVAISRAKVWNPDRMLVEAIFSELVDYVNARKHRQNSEQWMPNFNKELKDYYHPETLSEILAAREWFGLQHPWNQATSLILACTMHVLHGNRPYALSRRSHPVTPFSPSGETVYKSLIEKVRQKLDKSIEAELPEGFENGTVFESDATNYWPEEVENLDAILTSPPFFSSTRFYSANWIRLWFSGWGEFDFKHGQQQFLETKQLNSFDCYKNIFRQSKERLKSDGVLVLHLGKSHKCDMAMELSKIASHWFGKQEVFDESVSHCESHGIRDKGSVTEHQYLLLY